MVSGAQGAKLVVTGTALTTNYTASDPIQIGRAGRVRFWVKSVRASGSAATTTTIKLQMRYNDGTVTTTYVDLPSHLDDVAGSAQPKGSTFEVEHAFSTGANATTISTFYLDKPAGLLDITINAKAGATGHAGDSTTVYVSVG